MMTFRDQTDHPAYKGIILITLYTRDNSDTCIPRDRGPSAAARTGWGTSAAAKTYLGSCRMENCSFGKLSLDHPVYQGIILSPCIPGDHPDHPVYQRIILITLYTRGSSWSTCIPEDHPDHPVYQRIILITLWNKEPPDHPVWQGIILIPLYNKGSPWSPLYTRGSPYHPGYL